MGISRKAVVSCTMLINIENLKSTMLIGADIGVTRKLEIATGLRPSQ